jgi:hypothetical protein
MKLIQAAITMMVMWWSSLAPDVSHVDASTPREVQVRIAKLAAPKEITDHANIYILGARGYELAERGDNGFSCMIEREKPDTMEPECYDAEGSRTTVKVRLYEEQQRAKGVSDLVIEQAVKAGYKSGKFKPPSKPGIVYMLSDYDYVLNPETGKIIHFPGHLMFYAPYATEKTVGSGEGAPYIVHPGEPDALMIVVPAKSH